MSGVPCNHCQLFHRDEWFLDSKQLPEIPSIGVMTFVTMNRLWDILINIVGYQHHIGAETITTVRKSCAALESLSNLHKIISNVDVTKLNTILNDLVSGLDNTAIDILIVNAGYFYGPVETCINPNTINFEQLLKLAFVEANIDHVISIDKRTGVQDEIAYEIAYEFANAFYKALTNDNDTIEQAFRHGKTTIRAKYDSNKQYIKDHCCCAHIHLNQCRICGIPRCRTIHHIYSKCKNENENEKLNTKCCMNNNPDLYIQVQKNFVYLANEIIQKID